MPAPRTPAPADAPCWSGEWVADRLGITLTTTASASGLHLPELVGLAVRRNPRRAHLLVSTVLGKHVPTDPRLVYAAGLLLGRLTGDVLAGRTPDCAEFASLTRLALAGDGDAAAELRTQVLAGVSADAAVPGTVVLGYAETATALGHAVADALGQATYLHSTRRLVPGIAAYGGFEEEHSHATSHLLLPADPALLTGTGPLVLVDDELSTGTTALNTIVELHALAPRDRYVIAALIDLRSPADRARMDQVAAGLGARIDVVALAAGHVDLPAGILTAGQDLVAATETAQPAAAAPPLDIDALDRLVHPISVPWPMGLPDGGRHGFTPADRAALQAALPGIARQVGSRMPAGVWGREVLVLGFEELMYAPLRIAEALADCLSPAEVQVRYSTTTRSPVLPVDDPGYAIRTSARFAAHDDPTDGPGPRYAYNIGRASDGGRYAAIVLVIDVAADTPELHGPDGLIAALAGCTDTVLLLTLPSHLPPTAAAASSPARAGDTTDKDDPR